MSKIISQQEIGILLLLFVALGFSTCVELSAQSFTATIVGTVKDTSGAVIPGVEVTFVHLQTNRQSMTITSEHGYYVSPPLSVGNYRVEATLPGFKRAVRSGIVLEVQQAAVVDFTLEIGELSDSVEVRANTQMLEPTTSTLGKVVDNRRILELPLNTRNVYTLVALTPGFAGDVGHRYGDMRWAVYGTRTRAMDILIDGLTAAHGTVNGDIGISVFPSVDAIQEFKVMGSNLSAEYGRTMGTVLNVVYKSGTNEFHGSVYNFLRNSVLDANDFFSNLRGRQLGSFKRNQFGGVLGGPIQRNKTFFLVSYEGLRERSFQSRTFTVPTLLERKGDFSRTFNRSGRLVQIFNPFSTKPNPNGRGFVREPFPGNAVPSSLMDPVALSVIKFYPLPNVPGEPFTNRNNYFKTGSLSLDTDNYDFRVDHHFSDMDKVFVRYSHRYTNDAPAVFFPSELAIAEGRVIQENRPRNLVAEYTRSLSPTSILAARLGAARTIFVFSNQGLGFKPSSLGLPESIDRVVDRMMFPRFGANGYVDLGGNDHRYSSFNTVSTTASLTQMWGAHTLKFGYEGRLIRANVWEARSAGTFRFEERFTQGPDPLRSSSTAGNSIASLLLGTGRTGDRLIQNWKNVASQSYYFAGYVQDDWRLSQRLTLNLGLRYDLDTPRTERFNRMNYFDPDVRSPLADVVPGRNDLKGGLIFVGVDGRSRYQYDDDTNNFGPRLGLAYQLTSGTVLRVGYGHIFGASMVQAAGTVGPFGFRTEYPWVTTLDGITPFDLLRNPFPQGFRPSPGASEGLLTQVGANLEAALRDTNSPWSQQWNFTVQHEFGSDLFLEAGYLGNRGRELHASTESGFNLNQLDPKHMALGSKLNELVPNPFFGIVKQGVLVSSRISRAQLLRPFPQFTDIIPLRISDASSWYHAFQLTTKKRMSHGIMFEGSYVWSKTLDEGTRHQDSYNIRASRALADTDITHRFVISYIYELPFGQGRSWGKDVSKLVDWLIGGWQLNGITFIQSGTPRSFSASNTAGIFAPNTFPNNSGRSGKLTGRAQGRLDRWFDTSAFSQPEPFTFGNMGPVSPDIRNDSVRNFDLSLFKEFQMEKVQIQFRIEALNAFNTPRFGNPNTSVISGSFGRVTSQANAPRQIQFGLKLLW